jgi:hypothetical protein
MSNDSTRFQQLMSLADDGDETAVADLFKEFGYQYPASAQKRFSNNTCATRGRRGAGYNNTAQSKKGYQLWLFYNNPLLRTATRTPR